MGIQIKNATATITITPELRVGFASSNEARNIVHELLSGAEIVNLQNDAPRRGTLQLLFTTAAAAETARQHFMTARVWTITDDLAKVSFQWVREGSMDDVQQESRRSWLLNVGYHEVIP